MDLLRKVEHTLHFVRGEFPDIKDEVFNVNTDFDSIAVRCVGHMDELKLPLRLVQEDGDGQYYGLVRDFVKGVSDELAKR